MISLKAIDVGRLKPIVLQGGIPASAKPSLAFTPFGIYCDDGTVWQAMQKTCQLLCELSATEKITFKSKGWNITFRGFTAKRR
jgi:hypothetical protein